MPTNVPLADWRLLIRVSATALFLIAAAPRASAQADSGGLATATVSGIIINDETKASFAASLGYRFNRVAAATIELTVVPSLTPSVPALPFPLISSAIYPSPIYSYEPVHGHATFFTGNLRLAVPTQWTRISPYLIGGAGLATLRTEIDSLVDYGPLIPPSIVIPLPRVIAYPLVRERITRTTTDLAVTIGGGISFMRSDHWSVDADARYVVVAGDSSADLGRFGGGITYRF